MSRNNVIFEPLMDSIQSQIMRTIETMSQASDQPRELLCVDAGKALILMGSSFLGNSMGLDAETGLEPGYQCIQAYQDLARAKAASLKHF